MENNEDRSSLDDWVILCETNDYLESELIEALLRDSSIEYLTKNTADSASVEPGTGVIGKITAGIHIIIYIKKADEARALNMLNEDRSHLLDRKNLDFGIITDDINDSD